MKDEIWKQRQVLVENKKRKTKRRLRLLLNRFSKRSYIQKRKVKGVIIPLIKICTKCRENRVTHHHFLCNHCWDKKRMGVENEM